MNSMGMRNHPHFFDEAHIYELEIHNFIHFSFADE